MRSLTHRQSSLQLAGDCAEAVEHKVLPNTVDPLPTGREGTANEVTTFSLTRTEASDNLDTAPKTKANTRLVAGQLQAGAAV